MAAYPLQRATDLAEASSGGATLSSAVHVARRRGVAAMYEGVARTAVGGVMVGALTFGVYDAAMRMLLEGLESRQQQARRRD